MQLVTKQQAPTQTDGLHVQCKEEQQVHQLPTALHRAALEQKGQVTAKQTPFLRS